MPQKHTGTVSPSATSQPSATGQASAPGPSQYTALCQFYPYTRCKYVKVIRNNDDDMIQEWKKHVCSHYRDLSKSVDDTLYCWFKDCPRSKRKHGFECTDLMDGPKFVHWFLEHMLAHFQNEPWRKREDLRVDEWHIAMHAWASSELWNAYHNPDLSKQMERLPKKTFDQLCDLLEIYGVDKNRPEYGYVTKLVHDKKLRLGMIRAFNEKYDDKLNERDVMGLADEEAIGFADPFAWW